MTKRIGGSRRKTRQKFAKDIRKKGKISIKNYFQTFKGGDKVYLVIEPAVASGMYHTRYYGKTGIVKEKRGRCYEVAIKDKNKQKLVIVHPVHLKRV